MKKPIFNGVETYLLNNWTDARLIERSLDTMREKYEVVLNKVIATVRKKHPDLDHGSTQLDVDEDNDEERDVITLGVSKRKWSSEAVRGQPSGLWLSGITLGELIISRDKAPCANVFLWPRKDSRLDLADIENRLENEAKRIMPNVTVQKEGLPASACIFWPLPESSNDLLKLLLDDESRPFVSCLVSHFEMLASFIPFVDEVFEQGKAKLK